MFWLGFAAGMAALALLAIIGVIVWCLINPPLWK